MSKKSRTFSTPSSDIEQVIGSLYDPTKKKNDRIPETDPISLTAKVSNRCRVRYSRITYVLIIKFTEKHNRVSVPYIELSWIRFTGQITLSSVYESEIIEFSKNLYNVIFIIRIGHLYSDRPIHRLLSICFLSTHLSLRTLRIYHWTKFSLREKFVSKIICEESSRSLRGLQLSWIFAPFFFWMKLLARQSSRTIPRDIPEIKAKYQLYILFLSHSL